MCILTPISDNTKQKQNTNTQTIRRYDKDTNDTQFISTKDDATKTKNCK